MLDGEPWEIILPAVALVVIWFAGWAVVHTRPRRRRSTMRARTPTGARTESGDRAWQTMQLATTTTRWGDRPEPAAGSRLAFLDAINRAQARELRLRQPVPLVVRWLANRGPMTFEEITAIYPGTSPHEVEGLLIRLEARGDVRVDQSGRYCWAGPYDDPTQIGA